MGLFSKRPFALFSLLFLMSALFAYDTSNSSKLWVIAFVAAIIIVLIVLSFCIKRVKYKLLTAALCIFAVIVSLVHSLVFVGIPVQKAEAYEGENTTLCYIIDEGDSSEYRKEYSVIIKRIGDDSVNIKALLICSFDANVKEGDELYGVSQIKAMRGDKPEQLLTVYMETAENCYARYSSEGKGIFDFLFSDGGIELLSGKLSDIIENRLISLLGDRNGALAMGFFTGDRSEIPANIVRDFRRAGVSHIMAVSGTHISILLGGIELILRKLKVHKNIRCAVVTFFSLGFLFITGFSLSACRSVFMLYAVYIAYFTYEDSDPVTSLFVSIMAIVLIFPHSIVDLGMWMSFLATLGLLTVYPIVEAKIPYPRKVKKPWKKVLSFGRELLTVAIMTVIANMFLLPVIWYYFKEFSLVSILSNILISSLSSVFLMSVPILLIVSWIPIIGVAARWIVSLIADIIIFIVGFCSKMPNATVSLKYEFCKYIVIAFAVSMAVLLIVKLRKKIFVLLPYACTVVAFVVCLGVYSLWFSTPTVAYLNYDGSEMFVVNDNADITICDSTSGGFLTYMQVRLLLEDSYATEIDNYIFTSCHGGHITFLELLSQEILIRSVYLPTPQSDEDIADAKALYELAKENGIDVKFYNADEQIASSEKTNMRVTLPNSDKGGKYLCFWSNNRNVVYSSPWYCDPNADYDILIIGDRKNSDTHYDLNDISAKKIYVSSRDLADRLILPKNSERYIPIENIESYKMVFPLN